MKNRCFECNTPTRRDKIEKTRHVAGYAFTIQLPAEVCPACGEVSFAAPVLADFDLRVARILLGAGITAPEALKFLRKVTGLQGKELAALLGVRAETVSRWEQGKVKIDRPAYALIRQLIEERQAGRDELAAYLRLLRKPPRLAKKIKVEEAPPARRKAG